MPELTATTVENTPFTTEERVQVEQHVRAALGAIHKNHELTGGQLRAIEEKVDYVVEATKRLGRLDWRDVFVKVMAEVMVLQALESDVLREFLGFAWRGLAPLFGGAGLPGLP